MCTEATYILQADRVGSGVSHGVANGGCQERVTSSCVGYKIAWLIILVFFTALQRNWLHVLDYVSAVWTWLRVDLGPALTDLRLTIGAFGNQRLRGVRR